MAIKGRKLGENLCKSIRSISYKVFNSNRKLAISSRHLNID